MWKRACFAMVLLMKARASVDCSNEGMSDKQASKQARQ
jgi:hypothetical protein